MRILRAVRFAAQLDFEIEAKTRQAIREKAEFLRDISAERIQVELTKLITSDHPERIIDAYELGITAIVLPEFDTMMETPQHTVYHKYDVGRHTVAVMQNIDATPVLRWAALLHDSAKPECRTTDEQGVDHFYGHPKAGKAIARRVLRRMKLDNDTIQRVERLVEWHDFGLDGTVTKKTLRRALNRMGPDLFDDYAKLRRADMLGQSDYMQEKKQQDYQHLLEMYREIREAQECLLIRDLKLDGKDLIAMGVQPGPDMGKILNDLLQQVLEEPQLNTKEKLKELVQIKWLKDKTE